MDLEGKKVTVVGMGRTGMALVRLLIREKAEPYVTEHEEGPQLDSYRRSLRSLGVPFECGGHTDEAFKGADFVIPSPGVSPRNPHIRKALYEGVAILGEMELAHRFCPGKILAVTGTNGKTTTTELLRTIIQSCGHSVILAGNNDTPLSAAVMVEPAPSYVVLEVSSYQLETAWLFRPWIGAILNVTPDHFERHGSIEAYACVKAKMLARQKPGDIAVVNASDPWAANMFVRSGVERWPFSLTQRLSTGLWFDGENILLGDEAIASRADIRLPGLHNVQNALAALSMALAGGFDWTRVIAGLRGFNGVEHRIEYVLTHNGAAWYNDSKSTNVDSLKVALESFNSPIILIAGGRGKGAAYSPLTELLRNRVKLMVTIGEDAPLLEAAFGGIAAYVRAGSMADAVAKADAASAPGDVVLLSPACASFDMFDSFEHRGCVFKECVHARAGVG